jgi:ribonucleotide reductase alpha subunit
VPGDLKRVFVTAHDIEPHWHMQMQAAFQKHCDSSISKTINFSHEATVDDVRRIYDLAVALDVKGVTVYRDGCRDVQPMALTGSQRKAAGEKPAAVVAGQAALARLSAKARCSPRRPAIRTAACASTRSKVLPRSRPIRGSRISRGSNTTPASVGARWPRAPRSARKRSRKKPSRS